MLRSGYRIQTKLLIFYLFVSTFITFIILIWYENEKLIIKFIRRKRLIRGVQVLSSWRLKVTLTLNIYLVLNCFTLKSEVCRFFAGATVFFWAIPGCASRWRCHTARLFHFSFSSFGVCAGERRSGLPQRRADVTEGLWAAMGLSQRLAASAAHAHRRWEAQKKPYKLNKNNNFLKPWEDFMKQIQIIWLIFFWICTK